MSQKIISKDEANSLLLHLHNKFHLPKSKSQLIDIDIAYQSINSKKPTKITCLWNAFLEEGELTLDEINQNIHELDPIQCGYFSEKEKEILFKGQFDSDDPVLSEIYDSYASASILMDEKLQNKLINEYNRDTFPVFQDLSLIKANKEGIVSISNIDIYINWLNEYLSEPWKKKIEHKQTYLTEKECPSECSIQSYSHGTSLKRAKSIYNNGFYQITSNPISDLNKKEIGIDMRENWGGEGEKGVTYVFKTGYGEPFEHHAQRVASMDNDQPAVFQFKACVCNPLTPLMTFNSNFISYLKNEINIQKQTEPKLKNVREYAIRSSTSPVSLLQTLSTDKTSMGDLMAYFNWDVADENQWVTVISNPNKIMIQNSRKICTTENYDIQKKQC